MKKRIFTLGLALLLALSLTPSSASAQGAVRRLVVNGVNVLSAADPADVLGDGTVSYDAESDVLTLTDAALTVGLSDPSRGTEEHPAISFAGQLTLHLRGNNSISTGTDSVMGEALPNNAIYGDELTITGDPDATLEIRGMVQVRAYTQTGGSVSMEMDNDHTKITKWAMYVMGGPLQISGGTLTAKSIGDKRDGAIGLSDNAEVSIKEDAVLTEGDEGLEEKVSALSFTGLLMEKTKNYVKIEVPRERTAARHSR